jgi:hypothetical protein
MGQPAKEVERMYLLAHSVETALHDARFKLEDVEAEANTVRSGRNVCLMMFSVC